MHVLHDHSPIYQQAGGKDVGTKTVIKGIIWTVLCFMLKKNRIVGLLAGLSSLWVGSVFFASGFSEAEEAVATGMADEAVRQFFVSWNIPMHSSFAIFYTLCFFLLLLAGYRESRSDAALSVER